MSTVLAVRDHDRAVAQSAAAIAAVIGAEVHTVDPAPADALLQELGRSEVALGVVAAGRPPAALGWQLALRSTKPLLLVPARVRAVEAMITRVLVPLDGTPESSAAVHGAMEIFARSGAELVVLHVFDATTVPAYWDHPEHTESEWREEFLTRHSGDFDARLHWRSGEAADRIVDVATEEEVDVIALGWSRHLDGGHARNVVRTVAEAGVPVLLLPVPG